MRCKKTTGVVLDKIKMKVFALLIALSFAAKQNKNVVESEGHHGENVNNGEREEIRVKIEEDEYAKKKEHSSQFIGVSYEIKATKWRAQRHSKLEKKMLHNGSYENEETAARASDTLARKLMANGEQAHKLNFPDDDTEVFPEEKKGPHSQFLGVIYDISTTKLRAQRHSRLEEKIIYNGSYENEETAARASDTLARNLMANGEEAHKLNFPNDYTEVFPDR